MTWLDAITFDTVIVHTLNDGPSLRGLKLAVYDDGILLGEVVNLDNEPLVVEAGSTFVPREQVQRLQLVEAT
jgi:hypothetical protein